jgi:hypothetical protein
MSAVWAFDVAVSTHDWLRRGEPVLDYRRVEVLAEDYAEAGLTAYAMAAGPDDVVVTDLMWRY